MRAKQGKPIAILSPTKAKPRASVNGPHSQFDETQPEQKTDTDSDVLDTAQRPPNQNFHMDRYVYCVLCLSFSLS